MDNIKIAFIFGENDFNGKFEDGQIDIIYRQNPDKLHSIYFIDYFNDKLKCDEELQKFNLYSTYGQIAVELSKRGIITFIDCTSYTKEGYVDEKYGKNGVIIMPENPTKLQVEKLEWLESITNDYSGLQIWYDYYVKDEIPHFNVMQNNNTTIDKMFESFEDKYNKKTR